MKKKKTNVNSLNSLRGEKKCRKNLTHFSLTEATIGRYWNLQLSSKL